MRRWRRGPSRDGCQRRAGLGGLLDFFHLPLASPNLLLTLTLTHPLTHSHSLTTHLLTLTPTHSVAHSHSLTHSHYMYAAPDLSATDHLDAYRTQVHALAWMQSTYSRGIDTDAMHAAHLHISSGRHLGRHHTSSSPLVPFAFFFASPLPLYAFLCFFLPSRAVAHASAHPKSCQTRIAVPSMTCRGEESGCADDADDHETRQPALMSMTCRRVGCSTSFSRLPPRSHDSA